MAVFPTARRELSRPSSLTWLIAASVLAVAAVSIPGYLLLGDSSRNTVMRVPIAETSSAAAEASRAAQGARFEPPLLAGEGAAALSASELQIAASEASSHVAGAAPSDYISEVSSVAVLGGATNEKPVATSEAPATEAQSVAGVSPPAQPVVQPQAPAVERWAAAGIVIETEGQLLDAVSLANIDAALSALPAGVLSNLGNPALGPLYILVNPEGRVLSGDQPYGGPANFFSTNEGRNELVLYPQQSVFTVIHELGHAYNLRRIDAGRYAMVLLDSEMRSFLGATSWNITSSDEQIRGAVDHMHVDYSYNGSFHWPRLSNDDPLEDFANSFASFFLDPESLQQSSPERYAWMLATFGR